MRISIALATYNGGRFLEQQLASIGAQTHRPCELHVGDDESSDDTEAVVKAFSLSASFPVYFHKNEKRLGYAANFIATALRCEGEWIAFSDQDDVWLPNKLQRIVETVSAVKGERPVFATHDVRIVDQALADTGRRLRDRSEPLVAESLSRRPDWSPLGCTQVFDRSLLARADPHHRFPTPLVDVDPFPHDLWVGLLANALGRTVYLEDELLLYRRHAQNASAAGRPASQATWSTLRSTGADYYQRIAIAENGISRVLGDYAKKSKTMKDSARLYEAASLYRQRRDLLLLRAMVYRGKSLSKRARAYSAFAVKGIKMSKTTSPINYKSYAKDFAAILRLT